MKPSPGRWFALLFGAWVGAWFLFRLLEPRFAPLQKPLGATAWWTAAKLVIWIAPVVLLTRRIPLAPGALRLGHLRGVPLALIVAVGWVALNAAGDSLLGRTPAPALDVGVLSACFIAPFVEELVFRGFAFAWLEQLGLRFWKANLVCAVLFAVMHLPGWLFMQGFSVGLLAQLAQTALLGFGFGVLRRDGASLWAPFSVHLANNAWSTGLISFLLT
ncbi:MAG: type II CAAX endopeptidase family protein [Archangium sp.]|nr:type II CAAX endopeptidase family protein [Archangium sp.]